MCKLYYMLCLIFSGILSQAQPPQANPSYFLQISRDKTTSLIFSFPIKSVDRGSRDILAQVFKDADTILLLKAGTENFPETNLSVVTADGVLHLFVVGYSNHPTALSYRFGETIWQDSLQPFDPTNFYSRPNVRAILQAAEQVSMSAGFMSRKAKADQTTLKLTGIYLQDNLLWFAWEIKNKSYLPYRPAYMRLFLRNIKTGKRTALQESEITPVYNNFRVIRGKAAANFTLAVEAFSLPKGKELIFQIAENSSGRELIMHLSHKTILKAHPL